jgi:hypothetical protein
MFSYSVLWVRIGFNADLDPDPGFYWPKIVKFYRWQKIQFFSQAFRLKENIRHFKIMKFLLWVIFTLLNKDPDPHSQNERGSS